VLRPDALGELKRSPDHLAAFRGWGPRGKGDRDGRYDDDDDDDDERSAFSVA